MKKFELPKVQEDKHLTLKHFPTPMQAVVFRMWDMVPAERLAKVLKTGVEQVEKLARDMGLLPQRVSPAWQTKGYISILRSAWHILPYDQILEMLGWDEAKLAFILREDDFLGYKFGAYKPYCPRVEFRELTEEEKAATALLKQSVEESVLPHKLADAKEPFDLFSNIDCQPVVRQPQPENTVEITADWQLADETGAEEVPFFTELFFRDFQDCFGFRPAGSGKPCITLVVEQELSDEEEYHEIIVAEQDITIKAAYPVGILRGLMRLIELTRVNGGPYAPVGVHRYTPVVKTRYIYSFCGLYASAFDVDCSVSYPDELLRAYARLGINGVFTKAVLYKITEFPFAPALSEGWETRLENLKKTVARLKQYGIKLYIYLNEPRCMPLSFFEQYPELKGFERGPVKKLGMDIKKAEEADLCTSVPAVQQYMDNAVYTICSAAPDLGGFFAITRSEDPTNCYSHIGEPGAEQNCPRCAKRKPQEVLAEVYNIINRAARRVNPNIVTFCNTWAWAPLLSAEDAKECMSLIDPEVPILCISEESLAFTVGGVDNVVYDYTISKPGPSARSLKNWQSAKETGHEIGAKVQFNNTWECSTIPYIPVFDLIREHMDGLEKAGVRHLMLSWTLGGYPSDNLRIISGYFFKEEEIRQDTYDTLLKAGYGPYAEKIKQASGCFSKAFREFPFSLDTAYMGPHNAGVSNLLYDEPTGLAATMTCYCYDDVDAWRSIFPVDVYEQQHILIRDLWKKGMKILEEVPDFELSDMARGCYCIFATCCNQIRFVRLRNAYLTDGDDAKKQEMIDILEDEIRLAQNFYELMQKNPSIGYEAANHYYCNLTMIAEKIVSCRNLLSLYRGA